MNFDPSTCAVGSAIWASDLCDDETADLYVEINVDRGRQVYRTRTRGTMCWDEDLKMCVSVLLPPDPRI